MAAKVNMSRGRGRGRGRGKTFGGLEVLTILPGEPAPPPILQPPPLFPVLDQKPLELRNDEIDNYMLSVKQDLRQFMRQGPFHLKVGSIKREIRRYSDKYQAVKLDNDLEWTPDWSFFPGELKIRTGKRKRREVNPKHKPVIPASKRAKRNTLEPSKRKQDTDSEDALSELLEDEADAAPTRKKKLSTEDDEASLSKKFEQLEKTEETEAENESGEDAWTGDEEYYDEEGQEEGTDYNMSYFDNGEQYGGDEDDALEEGPCY